MAAALTERINQFPVLQLRPDISNLPIMGQVMVRELAGLKPLFDELYMILYTRHGFDILVMMREILPLAEGELIPKIENYITYIEMNKGNRDFRTTKRFIPDFSPRELLNLSQIYDSRNQTQMLEKASSLLDEIFKEGFVESGIYPQHTTKEKIDFMKQLSGMEFDDKFSIVRDSEFPNAVVPQPGAKYWKEVPYTQAFRETLLKLCSKIKTAADYGQQAGYDAFSKKLHLLATGLITGDFTPYWQYTIHEYDPRSCPVNIHFNFEEYVDHVESELSGKWEERNIKSGWNFNLDLLDHEMTARVNDYLHFLDKVEANLPLEEARRPDASLSKKPTFCYRNLIEAGGSDSLIRMLAWTIPNRPWEDMGREKAGFSDAFEGKSGLILEKIIEQTAEEGILAKYDSDIVALVMARNSMMHESGHDLGKKSDIYEKMEDHGSFEEAYADMGIFMIYSIYAKESNDPMVMEAFKCTADLYLFGLLRQIRFGPGSEHARSAHLIINTYLDEGAIKNENGRFIGDTDKIIDVSFNKLYPALQKIRVNADESVAKELRPRLNMRKEVVDIIETRLPNVPVDIRYGTEIQYSPILN